MSNGLSRVHKKARHKAGAVREIYRKTPSIPKSMLSLIVEISKIKKELRGYLIALFAYDGYPL